MWCVYLIRSKKDKSIYIGLTQNLKRRLAEHNSGQTFSTKSKVPWELIYCEIYKSEEDAKKREESLKLHARALAQLKRRLYHSLNL